METTEDTPHCTLKCLRNIEDVTHKVHLLKYGLVCTSINYIMLNCSYKLFVSYAVEDK